MKNTDIGNIGEDIALNYLLNKGYILLCRNYRQFIGEIDLIMQDENQLVFIEVKARKSVKYGYPRDFVTKNKQRKILDTACLYIQENNLENYQPRFDVVEIYLSEEKRVEHIENAFP